MSKLQDTNRKFNYSKQRWETLTANIPNKENIQMNNNNTVKKTIKKCSTAITFQKKQPLPQRTITKYFKMTNIKKYPHLQLYDSKGYVREFQCYDDKVLNIPPAYNQTISHSMDNDCQSDNEQVESAVRQLKYFLESTLNQYKQQHSQ
ncbi:unnamed protein product [Paramecium primaurelia]|uniref:Uncharacterized protein n=1 Tax=Paramecium primaurelia TaxID=5886 RepID=A0A8S1M4W5_PARPR|nr:unnamed protein product [Paramecium primaurelia]